MQSGIPKWAKELINLKLKKISDQLMQMFLEELVKADTIDCAHCQAIHPPLA